jgi:hypothetical protein
MEAGLPLVHDSRDVAAPRAGVLLTVRNLLGHLPFYRAFVGVEASLLALGAALIDAVRGDLEGTQTLLIALVAVGVITGVGHLIAILASKRLQ